MEAPKNTIPNLLLQSPAVDFIDNHLAKYHPAFADHHVQYDHASGRFVVVQHPVTMTPGAHTVPSAPLAVPDEPVLPPRPLPSPVEAMKFWDDIFLDARLLFENKYTEDPTEPLHSIRGKANWESVYDRLEKARNAYNSTKGIQGKVRKIYRKIADNIQPAIEWSKFVPDIDYVTPVLGAVQVLLEAIKQAGKTRQQILGGFDDLDLIFSEVELFLQTFPKDDNIKGSSTRLVAIIFRAIELAIHFFTTKSWGRRVFGAISKGDEYQKEILDSFDEIQKGSSRLIQEAEFSQMDSIKKAMGEVLKRTWQWKFEYQAVLDQLNHIRQSQKRLEVGQEHSLALQEQSLEAITEVHSLLQLYDRGRQDDLARYYEQKAKWDEEIRKARAEDAAKEREIARLQGVIRSISPMPRSSSLYVPPPPPVIQWSISPQDLWASLNIGRLEEEDLAFVNGRRARLPSGEKAQAEQVVQCHEFKEWILFPTSAKLLVHGNFKDRPYVSALSLFCATLYRNLQEASPRFVPLIFFCGRHVGSEANTGGRAMIKSLIAQLLLVRPFDTTPLRHEDVASIQQGDLNQLCNLFWWLVRQLPAEATVYCLIDGIVFYEREDFKEGMEHVLSNILVQMADNTIPAAVKVLITSPMGTRVVRDAFDPEWILPMEAMTRPGGAGSGQRLNRRLKEGLSGGSA